MIEAVTSASGSSGERRRSSRPPLARIGPLDFLSLTCAPVGIFAIQLDISGKMILPENPSPQGHRHDGAPIPQFRRRPEQGIAAGGKGAAGYDRMRHSATSWKRETNRYALIFTPTMAQEGDAANAAR